MSGVTQAVFMNQRSFIPPVPVVGSAYEGGFFAGQISTAGSGIADYNLVIAPKSSGQNNSKQWKTSNTTTVGTDSVIDGPANSSAMNNASHPAAEFCEGLTIGSFSDWYMPALNELEVCYYNLKPTTTSNNTGTGINTYAVPSRGSNYTSSVPGQTSATDFLVSTGTERFDSGTVADRYWVSTQTANPIWAWGQAFSNGSNYGAGLYKGNLYKVRAVRRVAV